MVDVNGIPFGGLNDPYPVYYWHCIGGASLPDHGTGCGGETASVIIQPRVVDQIEKFHLSIKINSVYNWKAKFQLSTINNLY